MVDDIFKYLLHGKCGAMTDEQIKYFLINGKFGIAEIESETLPMTFKAKRTENLKNYRIYGNTVNGESVGDRTENLFNINDLSNGAISITDGVSIVNNSQKHTETYIPVNGSQSYTLTARATLRVHQYSSDYSYFGSTLELGTFITNANAAFIRLAGTEQIFVGIVMLNMGSTAPPYEPYGYKVPVTVNEQTTNIYLNAPLAKSGNNADYIDFKTQKRYNSDGTEITVTLPEIAVTTGTNTLTVGTEIQPSKVYLQGHISRGDNNAE